MRPLKKQKRLDSSLNLSYATVSSQGGLSNLIIQLKAVVLLHSLTLPLLPTSPIEFSASQLINRNIPKTESLTGWNSTISLVTAAPHNPPKRINPSVSFFLCAPHPQPTLPHGHHQLFLPKRLSISARTEFCLSRKLKTRNKKPLLVAQCLPAMVHR